MTPVVQTFQDAFNRAPAIVGVAPGRVEALGNHTDYNDGVVLSCAIDRDVHIALAPSGDGDFGFMSTHFPSVSRVREVEPRAENAWVNYPLGVYAMMREAGHAVKPFCAAVHGEVPLGAGLSSSAALEVATAIGLRALYDCAIDDVALAKLCQKAENEFVGTNCGLLDQFTSLFGKAGQLLFTDFRTLDHRTVALPAHDTALAITTSGVTHSLVESAYNDRRRECATAAEYFGALDSSVRALRDVSLERLHQHKGRFDEIAWHRALHVVGENDRVMRGIGLLEAGDMAGFGQLLYASHESSRLHFENSCPELDMLVDIASSVPGVYGARLSGGGFGGATLTLMRASAKEAYAAAVKQRYRPTSGARAAIHFASIADGARLQ
jgi:galactokinase